MTENRTHWSGAGVSCDEPSPSTGELCTKIKGHKKTHHVKDTPDNWYNFERADRYSYGRDYNDMTEGEWQAFGQYGY